MVTRVKEVLKDLAPKEATILEALKDRTLNAFGELREQTKVSSPVLADYLKRLQKKKLIERDIDTRKYRITYDGITYLERHELIRNVFYSSGTSTLLEDIGKMFVLTDKDKVITPQRIGGEELTFIGGTIIERLLRRVIEKENESSTSSLKDFFKKYFPESERIILVYEINIDELVKWYERVVKPLNEDSSENVNGRIRGLMETIDSENIKEGKIR